MREVQGRLLDGRRYTDYIVDGPGVASFEGRLTDRRLTVDWTEDLRAVLEHVPEVQRRAGGPGSLEVISGYATAGLRSLMETGVWSDERAAAALERALGGTWTVMVTKVGVKWEVRAERQADDAEGS